jgi:hypothetical protein
MKTILLALFVAACTATKHPLEDVPEKYLHNLARIHGKTPREKLVIHHYHTFPTNILDMMNERNRLLGEADAFFDGLNEMTTTRIESAIDHYRDPFQEEYDEIAARRRIPRVEDVIPVERETSRKRARDSDDDNTDTEGGNVSPTLRIDFPGRDASPLPTAARAPEPAARAPEPAARAPAARAPEPAARATAPAARAPAPEFTPIPWPRSEPVATAVGPRPVAPLCSKDSTGKAAKKEVDPVLSERAKRAALTKKLNEAKAKEAAEAKAAAEAAKPPAAGSADQSGMFSESQADYVKGLF